MYAFHEEVFKVMFIWNGNQARFFWKQNTIKVGAHFRKKREVWANLRKMLGSKREEEEMGQTKGTLQTTNCWVKHVFKKKRGWKKRGEDQVVCSQEGGHTSGVQKKKRVWSNEEKVFVKNKTRVQKKKGAEGSKQSGFKTIFKIFF